MDEVWVEAIARVAGSAARCETEAWPRVLRKKLRPLMTPRQANDRSLLREMTLEEKARGLPCRGQVQHRRGGHAWRSAQSLYFFFLFFFFFWSCRTARTAFGGQLEAHSWNPLDTDEEPTTYLPVGVVLAATWNPDLAEEFGRVLSASEARAAQGHDPRTGNSI